MVTTFHERRTIHTLRMKQVFDPTSPAKVDSVVYGPRQRIMDAGRGRMVEVTDPSMKGKASDPVPTPARVQQVRHPAPSNGATPAKWTPQTPVQHFVAGMLQGYKKGMAH